jgi:hypothetical protein
MVIDTHVYQTARIPCVGSSPSHGLRLLSRILPEANVQETAVSGSPRPATTDHHEPSPISQEGNWEMHRGRTLTSPGMTWHDPESPSLVIHSHPESLALVPYCAAMACPVLGIGTLDAEHIPPCSRQAPAVCRFPWVLLPGRCSGGFYLLLAVLFTLLRLSSYLAFASQVIEKQTCVVLALVCLLRVSPVPPRFPRSPMLSWTRAEMPVLLMSCLFK